MDLTLIPFALRESDRTLVDVTQVARGGAAGCICPSCGTLLLARHGDVKTWHFAHATRSHYQSTTSRCDYSFFVSVRMMARQVIGSSITISLPRMAGLAAVEDAHGRIRRKEYVVTDMQTVEITNAQVEVSFGDVVVDVLGTVGDFSFVLYFKHQGREVSHALMQTAQVRGRCGVVVIDLDPLQAIFAARPAGSGISFLEELCVFITRDVKSKSWLYHPRNKAARVRAEEELHAELAQDFERTRVEPAVGTRFRYECVMCKIQWTHDVRHRACPTCRSLLYVRDLGSLP